MWVRFGCVLALSLSVVSCGGGSSGSSGVSSQPSNLNSVSQSTSFEDVSLHVDFPIDGSLSTAPDISFRGRVEQLTNYTGAEMRLQSGAQIFSKQLNDETWEFSSVPGAQQGIENFVVEFVVQGEVIRSQTVRVGFDQGFVPFGVGDALSIDFQSGKAYLLDDNLIVEIDLASGRRKQITDLTGQLSGDARDLVWHQETGMLVIQDSAGGLYLRSPTQSSLLTATAFENIVASKITIAVDGVHIFVYSSADRTLGKYDANYELVESFAIPTEVSSIDEMISLAGDTLALVSGSELGLLDLSSGAVSILSLEDLNLGAVGDLAADSDAARLFIRSASNNALWQLDFDLSLSPSFVASQVGLGGALSYAMSFDADQDALLFTSPNRLSEWRMGSQAVSTISELGWGGGADWVAPASLALSDSANEVYVSDLSTDEIYRVDMATGQRVALNTNGETMEAVSGMVQDGQNLYSVDWVKKSVLSTELSTGLTADLMVSGASQPDLSEPIAIDLDADRFRAFVLDRGLRAIYEVDTLSGNAAVLADSTAASALTLAKDLSLDPTTQTIYWSSWLDNGVYKLDLNGLGVELVSSQSRGQGANFGRPSAIALNAASEVAYLSDALDGKIFEVELATGDRRVVLNSELLSRPEAVAYDQVRGTLAILDAGTGGLYSLNPTTGDLVLISM